MFPVFIHISPSALLPQISSSCKMQIYIERAREDIASICVYFVHLFVLSFTLIALKKTACSVGTSCPSHVHIEKQIWRGHKLFYRYFTHTNRPRWNCIEWRNINERFPFIPTCPPLFPMQTAQDAHYFENESINYIIILMNICIYNIVIFTATLFVSSEVYCYKLKCKKRKPH